MPRGAQAARSWHAGSEDRRARIATEKGAGDKSRGFGGGKLPFCPPMDSHLGYLVARSVPDMVLSLCLQQGDDDLLRLRSSTWQVFILPKVRLSNRRSNFV